MNLKINSKYLLRVDVNNKILTYDALILEDDGVFITFLDRFNKKITYNKRNIVQVEEVLK